MTAIDDETVGAATDAALNDLFAASRSEASAAFDQLLHTANLAADSLLRINGDLPFLVRERANAIDVLLPGSSLALSKSCLPAFERLRAGPVRFSDVAPELTENDRKLFVKALVREGMLLVDGSFG